MDINVNVTTPDGQNYTITKDEALKLITVQIHGLVVSDTLLSKCLGQAKQKKLINGVNIQICLNL